MMNHRRRHDGTTDQECSVEKALPVRSDYRVDVHVGTRIADRRKALGLSAAVVSDMLGDTSSALLTMNERGEVRITPARLFALSRIMAVELPHFFQGL